jgi:hypothetical protein
MASGRAIDHVVLTVRDLDATAITYQRLGFTLTPRAAHGGHVKWAGTIPCEKLRRAVGSRPARNTCPTRLRGIAPVLQLW